MRNLTLHLIIYREFIADYECTNKNASSYSLRDSSRSFPSGNFTRKILNLNSLIRKNFALPSTGHASITMYTSIFLVWYLQCRIPKLQTLFFIPLLQSLLMMWTCLCCISRITDLRHHTSDIIGGALLGAVFSIYSCYNLSNSFSDDRSKVIVCNLNGSTSSNNNRRSVRRLLSTISAKDEFTLNNLE